MDSWVRSITSPLKKARTLINPPRDDKSTSQQQTDRYEHQRAKLQCEVMACSYEDVQVMWSLLDGSKPREPGNNGR